MNREMQQHPDQPTRRVRRPLGRQGGVKACEGMAALAKNVDDVGRHAPGEGDGEPTGTAAGGRSRRRSVLDLPEVDRPKRDRDGGELVN